MIKRMMLLASMALAAVAFTAPVAQADISLSDDRTLDNGADITATSSNFVLTRQDGSRIQCTTVGLDLKLIDDGTEHLEFEQTTPATTIGCELNREEQELPNLAVTIDDGTLGQSEGNIFTIDTSGTGTTTAFLRATIFGGPFSHESHAGVLAVDCIFAGRTGLEARGETSDTLGFGASMLGGLCGNGSLDGDFALKTHDGDPIHFHYNESSP